MKGSGTPVSGKTESIAPTFTTVWKAIQETIPIPR